MLQARECFTVAGRLMEQAEHHRREAEALQAWAHQEAVEGDSLLVEAAACQADMRRTQERECRIREDHQVAVAQEEEVAAVAQRRANKQWGCRVRFTLSEGR